MLLLRSPYRNSSNLLDLLDEFDRNTSSASSALFPYWNNADHSSYSFSNTIGEIINDDKQFGLQIDVSHFKPENLKVELNGRELRIEGEDETKTDHGYSKRSFSRTILLPEDCDLTSAQSQISNDGKLKLEISKKQNSVRQIPINFVNQHKSDS